MIASFGVFEFFSTLVYENGFQYVCSCIFGDVSMQIQSFFIINWLQMDATMTVVVLLLPAIVSFG